MTTLKQLATPYVSFPRFLNAVQTPNHLFFTNRPLASSFLSLDNFFLSATTSESSGGRHQGGQLQNRQNVRILSVVQHRGGVIFSFFLASFTACYWRALIDKSLQKIQKKIKRKLALTKRGNLKLLDPECGTFRDKKMKKIFFLSSLQPFFIVAFDPFPFDLRMFLQENFPSVKRIDKKLNRRFEAMTGLNTETAEQLQVLNACWFISQCWLCRVATSARNVWN